MIVLGGIAQGESDEEPYFTGVHLLENGKEKKQSPHDKQCAHFCRKMCFLMFFWHFDENKDLGSSKALVLIFLKRSLVYH